jgi:hypothetical protein
MGCENSLCSSRQKGTFRSYPLVCITAIRKGETELPKSRVFGKLDSSFL